MADQIGDLFPDSTDATRAIVAHVPAPASGFDYAALPADVADEARAVAKRIVENQELHLAMAVEAGRELIAIKDKLGHGNWLPWLERECGINARTAQNYMATAKAFGPKYETVAYLPADTVYKLAAPKAAAVREQVVSTIEAGEKLSAKDIENRIWQAEQEKKRPAKTETAAQKRARERREIKREIDWIDGREAERARKEERAAAAASIVDMLMSKLDETELAAIRKAWGVAQYPPIERAIEEWLEPERRKERDYISSKSAREDQEKRAKLLQRLERRPAN